MATLSEKERRTEAARKGQIRAMQGRQCPGCSRGNALKKMENEWAIGKKCRYCGWEKVFLLEGP